MSRKHSSIESFEDEDDMPCPCEVCGGWFDLMDGRAHPRGGKIVICEDCADGIDAEIEREEEIQEQIDSIREAEYTIKYAKETLQNHYKLTEAQIAALLLVNR